MTEQQARQRSKGRIGQTIGVGLLAAGALLVTAQLVVPDAMHQVSEAVVPEEVQQVGDAVVGQARSMTRQVTEAVTNDLPHVTLGPEAENEAIDTAPTGVFLEMSSYKVTSSLQPVFAAHNGSGGDIILDWQLGETILVTAADGSQQEMEVTDARDVPQENVTTGDILGMSGSILLQSCYWASDEMRIVALTPAGETPETPSGSTDGEDAPLVIP